MAFRFFNEKAKGNTSDESYIPNKKGLFSVLGNTMMKVGVGLQDPSALLQLQQQEDEANQQFEMYLAQQRERRQAAEGEAKMQQFQNRLNAMKAGAFPVGGDRTIISPDGTVYSMPPDLDRIKQREDILSSRLNRELLQKAMMSAQGPSGASDFVMGDITGGKVGFKNIGLERQKALLDIESKKAVDLDNTSTNAINALNSLSSLKQSYYEGFQPVDIKIDEATLFDRTGAKIRGLEKVLDSKLGGNPAAKTYLNNLKGFSTMIARGGLGERGTLTDKDRDVVVNMFNLALANKAEADYAFETMENILYKPVLKSAYHRMRKFGQGIEDMDMPQSIRNRIDFLVDKGVPIDKAVKYLSEKDYSIKLRNKDGK